jgi:DeoR/GlpR family transcriptional regulator of sugar metabolism/ABC-type sugar transport system substrate-binding protein
MQRGFMTTDERLDRIVALVEKRGFVSVKELSQWFDVSDVTIRRDLQLLDETKRLRRTYGGAASLRPAALPGAIQEVEPLPPPNLSSFLTGQVDALIVPKVDSNVERVLVEQAARNQIPIIAESLETAGMCTLVAVDNHQAGLELGRWAGEYASQHLAGQANLLDLTHNLTNTLARSQGFVAGLKEVLPQAQVLLSIDAQARYQTAYQLTSDALKVHPAINIIFAINDTTAWGAYQACQDHGVDPAKLLLITFGLEGTTLKDALMSGLYCQAGLAMFPEIVGPTCIEAAIDGCTNQTMPARLVTPHAILTPQTLPHFYQKTEIGWQLKWDTVAAELTIPLHIQRSTRPADTHLPQRIGFLVPFSEHEWYKNLVTAMQIYTTRLGIELKVVDADQNLREELTLRKRSIAKIAAQLAQPGEVILIDGGEVTTFLAQELINTADLTVITNSLAVFDVLRPYPNLNLMLTGGMLRHDSQTLIGHTAEAILRELRADRLFLATTGISLDFGLSHTNPAEVTMKQAMLRAAREVVLLADHTKFDQESVMQVAPITMVNKIITDNGLPASIRLDLTKLGVEIILAKT